MYIDETLATGIGAAFTTVAGGVGWFVGKIIKINSRLQVGLKGANDEMADMLRLQLTDNDRRRDLWDKVRDGINENTNSLKTLEREVQWLRTDMQRGSRT